MPKLNPKDISKLLEELYASDPSLRAREADLKRLIQSLADARPNAVADANFLQSLRKTLAEKAKALSSPRLTPMKTSLPNIHSSRFWPAIGFTFSGVAVGMMAMLYVIQDASIFSPLRMNTVARNGATQSSSAKKDIVTIQRIANGAFGQIAMAVDGYQGGAPVPAGMGGGGITRSFAPTAPMMAADPSSQNAASEIAVRESGDASVSTGMLIAPDAKIMPPYQMTVVEYAYMGDALELADTSLDVLKRSPGSFPSGSLASAIQGMGIGAVDLTTFRNANVGDVSIYQNEPYGYQVYLSPRNGVMSIDQNWEQWQGAYPNCTDDACWQASQLKASDIPSDEELLRIADAFMNEHRIDRSVYGPGEVDRSWEQYAYGGDVVLMERREMYVPDVVQVVYPLMIEGKSVYQNGGMKMGISVGVNVRVKRVSNVYNIQQLAFDASAYEAETSVDAVLKQAMNGGLSSPIRYMEAGVETKTVKAELGTPTRALVQIYQYKDNQSFELYVPALIFPVTKKPEATNDGTWVPNTVIVPLVKGIAQDMPQVMPLTAPGVMLKTEPAVGGGVSGSAGASVGTVTPSVVPENVPEPER